jgi:CRISPR-associated protein Cmr5
MARVEIKKAPHNARAKHAIGYISGLDKNDSDTRTLARSLPTMIQNNGICATVAFLKAKGKAHHNKLYENLENWIEKQELLVDNKGLLSTLVNASREEYRMISKEMLAYAVWVKRFAEGSLEDENRKSGS